MDANDKLALLALKDLAEAQGFPDSQGSSTDQVNFLTWKLMRQGVVENNLRKRIQGLEHGMNCTNKHARRLKRHIGNIEFASYQRPMFQVIRKAKGAANTVVRQTYDDLGDAVEAYDAVDGFARLTTFVNGKLSTLSKKDSPF